MLIFIDSFDHYVTADLGKKGWAGTNVTIGATGRRGGGALKPYGYSYMATKSLSVNMATAILGMSHTSGGAFGAANPFMQFFDGATPQLTVKHNGTGGFEVRNGGEFGAVLGTSANGLLLPNTEQYIELKVLFHGSTGTVEICVNGVSVLSLTGKNTIATANTYANGIGVTHCGNAFTNAGSIDDLYVCDATGSTNNNFLGDVRIDTIYPTSDGNYTDFTPSTGSSHFALVDETAPNTSDYNDGATVGDRDSYGLDNLSTLASSTVYGVQVNAAVLKDDAGAKSVATFVRSGGTNGDGASAGLGTSQVYVSQVYETNPNGSIAWTESTVNAMEAGVKVTA